MAANPPLVRTPDGSLIPAPFPNEYIILGRDGVSLSIDHLHTPSTKWHSDGTMFLTNFRLVYIAKKPDPSGLAAFDFPLVHIHSDNLNQPIFGANNLSGKVWPVSDAPFGEIPPHDFKISFKSGGIGTFYPMYYSLKQRATAAMSAARAPHQPQVVQQETQMFAQQAFIDPNDPSTVYLTQPVDESERLQQAPKFAENYGKDERYQDMGLKP